MLRGKAVWENDQGGDCNEGDVSEPDGGTKHWSRICKRTHKKHKRRGWTVQSSRRCAISVSLWDIRRNGYQSKTRAEIRAEIRNPNCAGNSVRTEQGDPGNPMVVSGASEFDLSQPVQSFTSRVYIPMATPQGWFALLTISTRCARSILVNGFAMLTISACCTCSILVNGFSTLYLI